MDRLQYINITMLILCIGICLILLICVATSEYRKEKLNIIFMSLVSCHIPLMVVDLLIVIFEGDTGLYSGYIFKTAYCLSFIIGSVLLILFTLYLLTFIRIKTAVLKKTVYTSYAAIALCAVNIIFIILTPLYGLYYTITSNVFVPGNLYWFSQLLAVICIALNTWIMLSHRKNFEKREFVFLLSYFVLPILALVIHNYVDGVIVSIDVATTLTILIFYAGIQSEFAKRLKAHELELIDARIAAKLSQIHPHFLFNSLDAIQDLCEQEEASRTEKALRAFSQYLRGNLELLRGKDLIPFTKELEHTKIYIALEHKRFEGRLNLAYSIGPTDFLIPALTLQPMVENAVRHGVTKRSEGGTITIRTTEESDCHIISIEDDGVGFNADEPVQDGKTHIGIENVRNRLKSMCGGTLAIHSEPGNGTRVTISIPKGGETL